jgi:hypothetical protein
MTRHLVLLAGAVLLAIGIIAITLIVDPYLTDGEPVQFIPSQINQ